MSEGEFSRIVKLDRLPREPLTFEADESERARLAARFDLPAIAKLSAVLTISGDGAVVEARGRLTARYQQRCAVAGDPFAVTMDEPLAIRFVPALAAIGEDEEHEFAPNEPDEIEYAGGAIDVGEAIAQSFGLALDPYATGPDAETARREAGLGEPGASGPFAALAALKPKP